MAYIVMAYIVTALYSRGLYSYRGDFLRAADCGIGAGGPKNKYLPICIISPAFFTSKSNLKSISSLILTGKVI